VLENETLRYRLSAFYGQVMNDLSPIDYAADKMPYRNTVRGLLSLDTQLLIRASCDGVEPLTCPGQTSAGGYGRTVQAILGSARIRPELTVALQGMAIRTLAEGVTGGFTPVLLEIDDLLARIEAELGAGPAP
jgi:hypothetical protein